MSGELHARINSESVYTDGDVRLKLDVTSAALARARRIGMLRYSRAGQRVLYRGQWLLDWLELDASNRCDKSTEEVPR